MATDSVYVTTAGAYVELDPLDALRATMVGAYVEITRASGIRVTTAGAYIEILSALQEDAAPILTARVDSPYEITLSLTYTGSDHLGFAWEKSADGSSWSVLGTTAADVTAYRHYEPLTPATTYYYRVRAFRFAYGAYSDVVSATTLAVYQLSDGNIFWVDMEEADGTRLGPGPILSGVRWRYTQRLSRAGEWELEVPAGEPLLSYIGLKKYFHCYVMRKGARAWVGGGAIEEVRTALRGNSAPLLVFSGADILRELIADTLTFEITSDAAAPGALGELVINTILGSLPADWTYTLDGVTPDMTARFVDESILGALVAATAKSGQFFRLQPYLSDGRALWVASIPSSSNVVATNVAEPLAIERNLNACLILEIEKLQSSWELVNRLIVYGAGDGEARLTMAAATQWPDGSSLASPYTLDDVVGNSHTLAFSSSFNTVEDTSSTGVYGTFTRPVKFKDIAPVTNSDADVTAAANVLVTAAVNELLSCALPQEHYSLRVAGLRKDVLPGQIIRVQARYVRDGVAPIDIDKDLIVLETQTEIDAGGARIVGLTVATTREFIKSDAEVLLQEVRQAVAMEAHPQMGPSENTISYREDIDDDYGAEFPFWLSNGTTLINSIVVRFKLDKLRSTVKSVAGTSTTTSSGGGTTATSSSGGGATPTSSSGGGSTPTTTSYAPVNNHAHGLEITDSTPVGQALYYDSSVGLNANLGTGDEVGGATNLVTLPLTHDHDVTVPSHTHSVTVPAHTHDVTVPDHTHSVTPTISAAYGIYEDPDPAYGVADLAWEINGGAISDTPTSIGGGWYEFDLTEDVSDPDTFRPLDSDNTLAVAVGTPTDKRVRVTVQIEIRTVIQSIAVV
jgi:hypothetical protein